MSKQREPPGADDRGAGLSVGIVGAGAIGVTAALDLAERGADVTVFEKGSVASGASGQASGIVYAAHADRRDLDIARRTLGRLREVSGDDDFTFTDCPYLWLARTGDEQRADAIRQQATRMQDHGLDVTVLSDGELRERFPAVNATDVELAAVTSEAGYTTPRDFVRLISKRAVLAGANVWTGTEVTIGTDPPTVYDAGATEYDALVIAAGAHTKSILADAGIQIPLKPYRVQALTAPQEYDGPIVYDATGGFYLRPHEDGILAGDGTEPVEVDPDDWEAAGDDWFVEEVSVGVDHRVGIDISPVDAWAGLCVATPDYDPLLGEVADGIYVAAGWQGHGFMRSVGHAEAISEQILGGEGISSFDPNRFDGDEEFEIEEGMAVK